ncbi:hypothetical protein Tco_0303731 [Tanacetum coccineum]
MMVEHTLLGYLRDNIPFEKINLQTYIWNHEVGSLAEKCIRLLSTESCLKELQLAIGLTIDSFTIPYELFCVKTLSKMMIRCSCCPVKEIVLTISNAGINCVSLPGVGLCKRKVLKEFKVRNLLYLLELTIQPHEKNHTLEIYDVPNFRLFTYSTPSQRNHLLFNRCVFGNVTELSLDGVIISDAWNRGDNYINVQIYAPKLHILKSHGLPVPSLKFSANVPKQIKLVHRVYSYGFDDSFFPKIREALMLTSEFDIKIGLERFDLVDINVDDVGRGVKFPATNVEHLTVETYIDSAGPCDTLTGGSLKLGNGSKPVDSMPGKGNKKDTLSSTYNLKESAAVSMSTSVLPQVSSYEDSMVDSVVFESGLLHSIVIQPNALLSQLPTPIYYPRRIVDVSQVDKPAPECLTFFERQAQVDKPRFDFAKKKSSFGHRRGTGAFWR